MSHEPLESFIAWAAFAGLAVIGLYLFAESRGWLEDKA